MEEQEVEVALQRMAAHLSSKLVYGLPSGPTALMRNCMLRRHVMALTAAGFSENTMTRGRAVTGVSRTPMLPHVAGASTSLDCMIKLLLKP